jgi:uncharacterized protein (UPF0212 family)
MGYFDSKAIENYLSTIIRNHVDGVLRRKIKLAKCPKCGADGKLKKSWKMAGRPDKMGKRMQLEIGLFECPKCHATFREVLSKKKI